VLLRLNSKGHEAPLLLFDARNVPNLLALILNVSVLCGTVAILLREVPAPFFPGIGGLTQEGIVMAGSRYHP
jgi:hypothetical protein